MPNPEAAELSDEALSLRIAEFLEPKPAKPGTDYIADVDYSPDKAWAYSRHFTPTWRPRDMIHDPAMTVMLLENILAKRSAIWLKLYRTGLIDCDVQEGIRGTSRELGRAVAEAFALANGLTVK